MKEKLFFLGGGGGGLFGRKQFPNVFRKNEIEEETRYHLSKQPVSHDFAFIDEINIQKNWALRKWGGDWTAVCSLPALFER